MAQAPEGFTLDEPEVPEGFTLDTGVAPEGFTLDKAPTTAHPYLAGAARTIPALVGGIGGTVLGPGGALLGGAAGGALGEVIAQIIEGRKSPGQVALSAALGAIPGVPLAKGLSTVARVGIRVGEGAGIAGAGQAASNVIEGRPVLENVPAAALVGAPFGLAGGLIEKTLLSRAAREVSPFETLVSQAEVANRNLKDELLDILPREPAGAAPRTSAPTTEEELITGLMMRETPEDILARRQVVGFEPAPRETVGGPGIYETQAARNRFNEELAAEALATGGRMPRGKYAGYDLAPAPIEPGIADIEALRSHAIQMRRVYNPEGLAERLIERSLPTDPRSSQAYDALYPGAPATGVKTTEFERVLTQPTTTEGGILANPLQVRPARRTTEVGARLMGQTPEQRSLNLSLGMEEPVFRKEIGPLQTMWNYVGRNATREVASYGKWGQSLADDVRRAADATEADYARVFVGDPVANVKPHDYLARLRALSDAEGANLGHVLNDGAVPTNSKVAQLADETRIRTREVGLRAAAAKLQIRNRSTGEVYDWVPLEGSYYPNIPDFDKIQKDPSARARTIAEIQTDVSAKRATRGHPGISLGEATNIFDSMRRNSRLEYGNLENARLAKLSEIDYDARRVLPSYFEKAYRRINEAEAFGARNEKAYNKTTAVGIEYGDLAGDRAKNFIDRITGRATYSAAERSAMGIYPYGNAFEVVTKLPLAFINNASQPALIAMKIGYGNTLKAYQELLTEGGKDFAKLAAGTLDQVMRDIQGVAGPSTVSNVVLGKLTPFTRVEQFNRRLAAIGGKVYAEDLLRRLQTPGTSPVEAERVRRAMRQMAIEPMEVLRRGGYTLDELFKAGRYLKNTTQFQTGIKDLPLGWTGPFGRFIAQLSNFGFKAGEFIWNDIFKEAGRYAASAGKEGDIRPFVRYLLTAPIVGEAFADISSGIRGTERPENPALRMAENVAYVGGLGIAYDAWRAALYGTTAMYRRLLGPQISDVVETGSAVFNAARQQSTDPLKKQLKAISPITGTIIRQTESTNTFKDKK